MKWMMMIRVRGEDEGKERDTEGRQEDDAAFFANRNL